MCSKSCVACPQQRRKHAVYKFRRAVFIVHSSDRREIVTQLCGEGREVGES